MSNKPWECPRCEKINAPWLPHCYCVPKEKSQDERLCEIIGEKWVLMFSDEKGEVIQGFVSHHEHIPQAVKNVLAAQGRNIYLEDRTPWRRAADELTAKTNSNHYGRISSCSICNEWLLPKVQHKCKVSKVNESFE
ncbi:MAG TPA: hypothetical protein VHZ76_03305 [Gammaproteobacteria bacterium]|jgi:hypothetical protein|nr:hypothetical protein [Gammaproteobacteria bacterium]